MTTNHVGSHRPVNSHSTAFHKDHYRMVLRITPANFLQCDY